jgi:ectoine hydroxylase-related dioxygenase (phytanoyl-CoA dioxygenase family)
MDRRDLLTYHQAFIDLIDRPRVFDLILDLMGPYIQFSMSQAIVRASTETFPGYTHTDGGEAQRAIRVTETSRPLAVKVMYLLTDVTEPDSGNFTVFPGSHLRPFPERLERIPNPQMPGAVPLLGKAGDAYVFPHAIWHGRRPTAPARRARPSSTITARCSCAPTISARPTPSLFERCTPRQRRLLGDLGHDFRPGDFFYAPEGHERLMTGAA